MSVGAVVTVAKVAVSDALYGFDKQYSYLVPEELGDKVVPGIRVLVPFGKGNRKTVGFVLSVEKEDAEKLKPIDSVIEDKPLVNDEMLRLILWLSEYTMCTMFEAYRTVVPSGFSVSVAERYRLSNMEKELCDLTDEEKELYSRLSELSEKDFSDAIDELKLSQSGKKLIASLVDKGILEEENVLKRKVGDETVKLYSLTSEWEQDNVKLTKKQKQVVDFLEEAGSASAKEICYYSAVTQSIIANLVKKGVLCESEVETLRSVDVSTDDTLRLEDITLSKEQQRAYDGLVKLADSGKPAGALLYGVTGSGKTQVFIKLIEHTLKMGKTAIMLLPEISLTPQMVGKFRSLFGDTVAVIHSNLSVGQRADEFKRLRSGEAKIAIGTRSAVFAPLSDIGLIIMDEEGEHSYKSDRAPRYHARDVAIRRSGNHNCLLLMASATPSLESYYYAKTGRYSLFELDKRYAQGGLPQVVTVDMQEEEDAGGNGIISTSLYNAIRETLDKKEQVILLYNRRGFSARLSCMECRHIPECPNCSIPLTYHKANGRLMCHYCGYSASAKTPCNSCGCEEFRTVGIGTQKVEDTLTELFPDAKILRMDADTTSSRYAFEKSFKAFGNGEYDIMLGTQMRAKGLDFSKVTLVGVVSLDKALYAGDFRSYERTFSLITQVVGRSGRGDKKGYAYIQTYTPEHYVLELGSKQDYKSFYNEEISLRKTLLYPPFCDICVVYAQCTSEKTAREGAELFKTKLSEFIKKNDLKLPLRILGPSACTVGKIGGKYRYRVILKCKNTQAMRNVLSQVIKLVGREYSKENQKLTIFADMNGDIS